MTRLDVLSPRPKRNGGTHWIRIGAAFPRDGGGYQLLLDALPLPDADGRCSLLLAEPRDQSAARGAGPGRHARQDPGASPASAHRDDWR